MSHLYRQDGLILGICNGFQALVKLGLIPYGEIRDLTVDSPTLTFNTIGRHVSCMVQTKVVSNLSPWLSGVAPGTIHTIPVSHGEGRFVADREVIAKMRVRGQIATQYVDPVGNPTLDPEYNPNGSIYAIEGLTSPDGRVFGKMGQMSCRLFERQVFGQGDFGGDLEAFAFGFDGAFVRTARQIIEAVAVASEMV